MYDQIVASVSWFCTISVIYLQNYVQEVHYFCVTGSLFNVLPDL